MPTQIEKVHAFRTLRKRSGTSVVPNPWDLGPAWLLVSVGFEALTSTSAGFAFSRELPDHGVDCDVILTRVADLAAVMDVSMAADLENDFDDAPETVAEIIRLAGVTSIVGGSIEDATGHADAPIYSLEASADRVRAAVGVARALPFPFTLTARPENRLHGHNDLVDMIHCLQTFQDASADVLYAPGLKTRDEIAAVLREINRSLNVLMGFTDGNSSVTELAEPGVKRISVGTTLARVAMGVFMRVAEGLRTAGTFSFARDAANGAKLNGPFASFA